MGVKGLANYMEHKKTNREVNIENMAKDHISSAATDKPPILLVDGMGFLNTCYSGGFDWIYGGQWVQFVSALKSSVERFQKAGIKLVFFFDGPTSPEKREKCNQRRNENAEKLKQLFIKIKRGEQLPTVSEEYSPPLTNTGLFTRFALKFSCNDVQVHTAIKEADIEIAEYARNNDRVFAILADDTDFIIFDTKPVLSLKNLKMNLTTTLYDRQKLLNQLNISLSQLPLFSCLLSNDFVSLKLLESFHKKCRKDYNHMRMDKTEVIPYAVSRKIRYYNWEGNLENEQELDEISKQVFGNVDFKRHLKTGIGFYSLSSSTSERSHGETEPAQIAREKHVNCENFPAIYGLLHNHEHDLSEAPEDWNDESLPSINLAFRPIRQRAYYVLFQRKLDIIVTEWCKLLDQELQSERVSSTVVMESLPELETLWSDSVKPETQDVKMRTFLACVAGKLSPSDMNRIQSKHQIPCCVLNYLLNLKHNNKEVIKPFEVKAFIIQMIHQRANDVTWLNNSVKVPKFNINTRAIHLASLFMRGVTTLGMVLGITGYPIPLQHSMPWRFFNGKFFHYMYLELKKGAQPEVLLEKDGRFFEEFTRLWKFIQTN